MKQMLFLIALGAILLTQNACNESDPSKMDFSSGSSKPKSWKEIWGSGQGINAIKEVMTTAALVDQLEAEYMAARQRLGLGKARMAAE